MSISKLVNIDFNILEYEWDLSRTVSPTSLNTFILCPFKWKSIQEGAPTVEVDRTAQEFGTAVHGATSGYYKSLSGTGWLTLNGIIERVESFVLRIENRPQGKNLKKIAENIVAFEKWRMQRYPNESQVPKAIELEFKVSPFHGFMDFVAHDFVLDWKTGTYEVTENNTRQVNAYFYACQKLNFGTRRGFLNFVESGMKPMIPINMEKLLKEAYAFFVLTSSPAFDYNPNPTYLCRWCEYKGGCQARRNYAHECIQSRIIQQRISRLIQVGMT